MSKMSNLSLSDVFFQALNTPKLGFGQGSAPDPTGGAYDASFPRLPSRVERGTPLPMPFPLNAFGVSIGCQPLTQIPGYPYASQKFEADHAIGQ